MYGPKNLQKLLKELNISLLFIRIKKKGDTHSRERIIPNPKLRLQYLSQFKTYIKLFVS